MQQSVGDGKRCDMRRDEVGQKPTDTDVESPPAVKSTQKRENRNVI